MKKQTIALLSTLASIGTLSASYADDATLYTLDSDFFYLTADAGYGQLTTPNSSPTPTGSSPNLNSLVFSAGVGYAYALDSFSTIGLEADYSDNGKAEYGGNFQISSKSVALLGTFSTMWTNGISVFIKGGVADVYQSKDYSGTVIVNGFARSGSGTHQAFEPEGVVGVGYQISPDLNIFTDFTYVGGHSGSNWNDVVSSGNDNSDNQVASSLQLKVGVLYQL